MNSPFKPRRFSLQTKIVLLVTLLVLIALAAVACFVKSVVYGTPTQTAVFEFVALVLFVLIFLAMIVGIIYRSASNADSVWKPNANAGYPTGNGASGKPKARFTFGIWSILLITFASAVTAAAASYYVKALEADTSPKAVFIIFAIAAPMLMLVFVSVSYQLSRILKARKKQKRTVYEYKPEEK